MKISYANWKDFERKMAEAFKTRDDIKRYLPYIREISLERPASGEGERLTEDEIAKVFDPDKSTLRIYLDGEHPKKLDAYYALSDHFRSLGGRVAIEVQGYDTIRPRLDVARPLLTFVETVKDMFRGGSGRGI